jgi:hypothetical protein
MDKYGTSVYDEIGGDVAAYISCVLVDVCMSHWSGVDYKYVQLHHH